MLQLVRGDQNQRILNSEHLTKKSKTYFSKEITRNSNFSFAKVCTIPNGGGPGIWGAAICPCSQDMTSGVPVGRKENYDWSCLY